MSKITEHKKIVSICAAIILVLSVAGIIMATSLQRGEETAYRETVVQYGDLTVGITESGSIEVGTTTQELELDISAISSATGAFSWQGGGMQMGMMGNPGTQTTQSSSQDGRALVVESIYAKEGQQITAGDALLKLTQDSVEAIREELLEDVSKAQLTLKQLNTQQRSTALSASQSYESNVTYGEAAQIEYEEALEEAQAVYTEAQDALTAAYEELEEQQITVEALSTQYAQEKHLYDEAAYLVEYIEKEEDPYGYVKALELRANALSTVEKTEEEWEEAQETYESMAAQIESLKLSLETAKKQQSLAQIEAQATYQTRMIKYQNASELYQIETGLVAEKKQAAQEEYDSATAKLAKLDATISEYMLVSEYDGVITQIAVKEGDSLTRGTELITLNNYDEVTMTVSVDDSDIKQIEVGNPVNITVDAFEEEIFAGTVEEISEAQIDSNSNVTYQVEVSVTGAVDGLYEGMSGEVTFITKETKEVIYVSNRAIYRDGNTSYVLLQSEDGTTTRQEVSTGFSDGVNAEILEGLQEGDVVLIESKVSDS